MSIALRCLTCGASYAFVADDRTGHVTCRKCNRVYRGGKDELIHLNEALIEDTMSQLADDVKEDIGKELQKIFKKLK